MVVAKDKGRRGEVGEMDEGENNEQKEKNRKRERRKRVRRKEAIIRLLESKKLQFFACKHR